MSIKPDRVTLRDWITEFYGFYRFKVFRNLSSVEHGLIFKMPVERMNVAFHKPIPGLRFKIILDETGDDAAELFKSIYPWKRREFKKRFRDGSGLLVGFIGSKIVFYCWGSYGCLAYNYRKEYNLRLNLNPDEAFLYDAYVNRDYRGKGILFHTYKASYDIYHPKQFKYLYNIVPVEYKGVLRMMHRLGMEPAYYLECRRFLGFKTTVLRPVDEGGKEMAMQAAARKGVDITFLWGENRKSRQPDDDE
jgi:hypothetical protein